MRFELDVQTREQLEALCRKYGVVRLSLFGSAATEAFDPDRSDLDFLVEFAPPDAEMRPATQFFGFREELLLLFAREIDLLETSAIENSRLRQSVAKTAMTLYAA